MTKKIGIIAPIIVIAGLLIWKLSHRAYPITNNPPHGTAVIAFGDSLTAGVGASEGHEYPTVLSQLIGVPVINRGVPGDTTENALARLANDVLSDDPRIVIICLGGNDTLQHLPSKNTFANLRRMIETIQAHGALIVLAGVRSASLTDQFDKQFHVLAKEKGCVFVPNVLRGILDDPAKRSDQVHPNDVGYKLIAERISDAVRPYL